MRKYLVLGLVLVGFALAQSASDNFNITVTVEYFEIILLKADSSTDYSTWALGVMATSDSATMTTGSSGTHILVDNNCSGTVDFSIYVNNPAPSPCGIGTPTAWTAGAAPGANTYWLRANDSNISSVPSSWVTITATSAPGDVYLSGVSSGNHRLYCRFKPPSSVSDGCQHTINVYVVAQ